MTDATLFEELVAAIRERRPVATATVVKTSRSVPRHPGSMMLIPADGPPSGTVGGGEMEFRVIEAARAAIVDNEPRVMSYDLVDPGKGDPGVCGGTVDVYIQPHVPRRQLVVVGCGHVGGAVVHLARWLGFHVIATDDRGRDDETAQAAELADSFIAGPIDKLLEAVKIGADTSIVVVSRNMGVDLAAIPVLLGSEAGYIGVMGSLRRWRTTRAKLMERGVTEEALKRVNAPIGLELNAETPEEIAVSILAEVIAHCRGGDGSPMRDPGGSE